jgi:hypothetical protein
MILAASAVAALVALSAPQAKADVGSFFSNIGNAIAQDVQCTVQSFRDGGVTLPASFNAPKALKPGKYRDAANGCAVAGREYGPQF